jgi:hypothetical protein
MNNVTYIIPAPWCPLPITSNARAYTSSDRTGVRRTIEQHTPPIASVLAIADDYDYTTLTDHLEVPGAFR